MLWFPSLLQSSNILNSDSFFNINQFKNPIQKSKTRIYIDTSYLKTYKFKVNPSIEQQKIIQKWYHNVITMYNLTNQKIKLYFEKYNKLINFYELRKSLDNEKNKFSTETKINKHILCYSMEHCYNMYKSAISNKRNGHIKEYKINDLPYNKRRKNLVLEPANFSKSKNAFCIRILGEIKSDRSIKDKITKNSILQYDSYKKEYNILTPYECKFTYNPKRENICGVDLGVRTFATIYSENQVLEIGTNLTKYIDKYNNKVDKLRSHLETKKLKKKKYEKLITKNKDNHNNKIQDLHKKFSALLCSNYDTIKIGKISTKKMVSNERSNLKEITKRRIYGCQFYKLYEMLKIIGAKYNTKIEIINEYMTTQTCHNCSHSYKIGSSKIYKCKNCKIKIDRDINSAINILKK
jgi:putative transposase